MEQWHKLTLTCCVDARCLTTQPGDNTTIWSRIIRLQHFNIDVIWGREDPTCPQVSFNPRTCFTQQCPSRDTQDDVTVGFEEEDDDDDDDRGGYLQDLLSVWWRGSPKSSAIVPTVRSTHTRARSLSEPVISPRLPLVSGHWRGPDGELWTMLEKGSRRMSLHRAPNITARQTARTFTHRGQAKVSLRRLPLMPFKINAPPSHICSYRKLFKLPFFWLVNTKIWMTKLADKICSDKKIVCIHINST